MEYINGWKEADKLYTANFEDDSRMVAEAEMVKQLLNFCSIMPGAKITISVEHDSGQKATAALYDHAALVQSLHDTLAYFQSEMAVGSDDD